VDDNEQSVMKSGRLFQSRGLSTAKSGISRYRHQQGRWRRWHCSRRREV